MPVRPEEDQEATEEEAQAHRVNAGASGIDVPPRPAAVTRARLEAQGPQAGAPSLAL